MKRRRWVPLVAVGLALVILVPTTFAVGEPGTTLYAQLGTNRFPGGSGAADASLTFNGERDIQLQIAIAGPAGTINAVRVYVDGTCSNPGEWVVNRTPTAGPSGPFLEVASNSGPVAIAVNQLDVDRIRDELADNPNETFALMVARLINGVNYRTCTSFRTTPFPPLTTTTTTTATSSTTATSPTTGTTASSTSSASTRTSTVFSTGTTVQTVTLTSGLTTVTLPATTATLTITTTSIGLTTATATGTFGTITATTTVTTPVTTQTIITTQTTTLGGTVTQTGVGTTFTTTSLFTTPVTTITTTL